MKLRGDWLRKMRRPKLHGQTMPRVVTISIAGLLCSLALALPDAAVAQPAQDSGDLALHTLPTRVTLGLERLRLPGDEGMGLGGACDRLVRSAGWWLGPALYGAATGRRGGLSTWGAVGQRRWRLDERWALAAGLYAGGLLSIVTIWRRGLARYHWHKV